MLMSYLLLVSNADAAGYYFSDVGVRSFSRGGAFVAGADDLTALYYNPAALTRLRGITTTLSLAGVAQDIYFDRNDYPGEGPLVDGENEDVINPPVENAAPAYIIPHFGVSGNLGLPNTTVALGFYPPYAPDVSYPKDGPQRYSLVDTLVIQTFAGFSAAHKFADWVSIGGGISWNMLIVEQELMAYMAPETITYEDPAYDVYFGASVRDDFALTWNGGILVEPPSGKWAVGGMFQPSVEFDGKGELFADFSENFWYENGIVQSELPTDEDVTINVKMPPIVRTGALVRPLTNLEIEFAYVWQGWSALESLVVTDLNLAIETSLDDEPTMVEEDIELPTGFKDAHSYRLGGQWEPKDFLTIRLGGNYETSAVEPKNLAPNMVDTNKIGYGAGLSYNLTKIGLSLDLGMSQVFLKDTTVTDSDVRQIGVDPLSGEVYEGRVIADGEYRSKIKMFGGGFTHNFTPKKYR